LNENNESNFDVGIIGLGYVGLTLASAFADVGLKVVGIERRSEVVDLINRGKPHFMEIGLAEVLSRVVSNDKLIARHALTNADNCSSFVITVGTPLSADGKARLDMIENATHQVANAMPDNALVILRSTVMIGTARNCVKPILERTGKRFCLAMCPERTLEGRAMTELRQLPQIIGADDDYTRNRASSLFSRLTPTVLPVSSLETAEIVKLADNTYRDVNFGFSNEIARLCDAVGVSAYEVISAGKLGYPRTNLASPGLVGGPCLEKDPHILRQSASKYGIDLEITAAARLVNERQPRETVDFIVSELKRRKLAAQPIVAILGLAFKGQPETDDLRGAMSLHVFRELRSRMPEAQYRAYDPVVSSDELQRSSTNLRVFPNFKEAITGAHIAVITNNHPEFGTISFNTIASLLAPGGFVYDYWNHYADIKGFDFSGRYFAVGNSKRGGL